MRNSGKILLAGAVVMVLGMSPWAQAAHSEIGSYTIGTTPYVRVLCSPDCQGQSDLNYGGYTFAPNGELPVSVAFADASGLGVFFTVSQDLDGDRVSGNNDPSLGILEPRIDGCGTTGDLSTSVVPFQSWEATDIFVVLISPLGCPEGLALGGTITMTYATPA